MNHFFHEKARELQKNIYFCFIDYAKAFDCVDHNKLENSERDGNTRPPDLPPEKSVCRSRSKLELGMEHQIGSKSGKEYVKEYCQCFPLRALIVSGLTFKSSIHF